MTFDNEVIASNRVAGCFAFDDETSHARRIFGKSLNRAVRTIVIHFTPRSGSTWLASILENSRELGNGLELFNPYFITETAKHYGARNLSEYIEMSQYFSPIGGILSFEVTSHDIHATFKNPHAFFDIYRGCPSYFLIREDIVSQAVSLAKMVSTGVSHSTALAFKDRCILENHFAYDGEVIAEWLRHILISEQMSESFFADHGVEPLRLSYEGMMKMKVAELLARIKKFADLPELLVDQETESSQQKIATRQNYEFAERFREEYKEWLHEIELERRIRLKRLVFTE